MEFNHNTGYRGRKGAHVKIYVLQHMRTEQDKINRKEANQRYYKLEENKEQKRNYMKAYRKRQKVYESHEEWARENGYRDNDLLHAKNTERFTHDT